MRRRNDIGRVARRHCDYWSFDCAFAASSAKRPAKPAGAVQCQNNLRQIGLALANFESANTFLPAGQVSQEYPPVPTHPYTFYRWSTLAQLLPYMEQASVRNLLDTSLPLYMPGPGYPISAKYQRHRAVLPISSARAI